MSISSLINIQNRIISATENSKIAVFTNSRGRVIELDAVFDNTIITQKRIKSGDSHYIGSYYGSDGRRNAGNDLRGLA